MTGFWLVSYLVLWLLVIVQGLVILALARELEAQRATRSIPPQPSSTPSEVAPSDPRLTAVPSE